MPGTHSCALVSFNFAMGMTVGLILTYMLPRTNNMGKAINGATPHLDTLGHARELGTKDGVELLGHTTRMPVATAAPAVHVQSVTPGAIAKIDTTADFKPVRFEDGHLHNDDSSVATQLANQVRVLCWIMTQPQSHVTKAKHVKATWGKRCNHLLFMSETSDPSLPAIGLNVSAGRGHLTAKTMQAFDYIYKHHINDFDWFLKADDDTYVIVENMRYMLSSHRPTDLVYFGHHFFSEKWDMDQGYFSGGGGYVLSRAALQKFGQRPPSLCASDKGSEDVEIGYCMERLGVKTGDSRDSLGRSRFHCFGPEMHLKGNYPSWYLGFDKYGAPYGIDNISDYAVSFHYISVRNMYALEFYVYHLRPFGVANGNQQLNRIPTGNT